MRSESLASIPFAWQEILANSNEVESVLRDGELDFLPWLHDFETSEHRPEHWEEDQQVLGQGAFGVVVRGVNRLTGELVAIKRIPPTHPLAVQTAVNEIEAAKITGQHPNVVQVKAWFLASEWRPGKMIGKVKLKDYRDIVIVYRLAVGGSLKDWIQKQHESNSFNVDYSKPKFNDESLRIMRELVLGLQHIHRKNVQHRDLKPANILLSAGGTAIIADFGIALVNRSSTRLKGHAALGDFYFIDVDALVNKGLSYSLDDDIYSMGEVFARLLYGSYATGNELRRYVDRVGFTPICGVVQVLYKMLEPRGERWACDRLLQQLSSLSNGLSLPSEPRPIVTEVFLGIGAVVTAAMLGERIRARSLGQEAGSSQSNAVVRVGQTQGKRIGMQDFYCHARVRWTVPPGGRKWRLLGAFDGHGGVTCAQFAARFLPHEVRRMLRRLEGGEVQGSSGVPSVDLEEGITLQDGVAAAHAVREALESLDSHFVDFKRRQGEINYTGTTASVALLSPSGRTAVLGNIGDSRAALAGSWEVVTYEGYCPEVSEGLILTKAHTPSDPLEVERIEKAGGFVELGSTGHRVNGVLGVSRALGYLAVKEYSNLIVAKSDVVVARRQGKEASMVALASDGVFSRFCPEPAEVFKRIALAKDAAMLDAAIDSTLSTAGGGSASDAADNVTVLACLLPGEDTAT